MEIKAHAADTTFVSQIVLDFKSLTDQWMETALKYARIIFYWCFMLEIAYLGIKAAFGRSEVGETFKNFFMAVLTAAFFMAVIENYQVWSWQIIDGLKDVASEMSASASSGTKAVGSDNPFKVGLKLAGDLWGKAEDLGFRQTGLILATFITSLIVLIIFALITAQVILIKCEAMVALLAAGILLGLGATSFFREYGINVLKYVVSVAFKLFVLELILNIGFAFVNKLQTSSSENFVFSDAAVAICVSIILLSLVSYLPSVVAGLIQASSVNGGAALMQAASTVGTVAGAGALVAKGAAAAGGGSYAAGKMLKGANALANADGASGLGKVASIGKSLWNARGEANLAKDAGTTMGSVIKQKLDELNVSKGDK